MPDMASRFHKTGHHIDLIISSPATRALTTATGFAKRLRIAQENFVLEDEFYHASTRTIKNRLSQVGDQYDSVMIFGHNPGLTSLIESLSDFNLYNLPTCAVCGISFDIETWKSILNTEGTKFYYDYPKSTLE